MPIFYFSNMENCILRKMLLQVEFRYEKWTEQLIRQKLLKVMLKVTSSLEIVIGITGCKCLNQSCRLLVASCEVEPLAVMARWGRWGYVSPPSDEYSLIEIMTLRLPQITNLPVSWVELSSTCLNCWIFFVPELCPWSRLFWPGTYRFDTKVSFISVRFEVYPQKIPGSTWR